MVEITVSLTADKADLTTADKMYVSYKAEPVAKVIVNDESVGKEIPVTNDYLDGQTSLRSACRSGGLGAPGDHAHCG
ncbi:MAG: hypothetical protein ACLTYN_09880 [Dysosmobacter welbionis]